MSDYRIEHFSFAPESTRIFSILQWLNSCDGVTHFGRFFLNLFLIYFFLYENIKNLQNYNFVFCLMWVWNPSPTWREEHTLTLLANRVLKKTFGPRVVSGTLIEIAQ
jgi:hypothetical protein